MISCTAPFVSYRDSGRIAFPQSPGLDLPVAQAGLFTGYQAIRLPIRHVWQISPDRNVNCRHTTAAFTLSPESRALLCCANLSGDWALYAVSVRRLATLHLGFLQTPPHGDALAFG